MPNPGNWSNPAHAGDNKRPPGVTNLRFDVDQHKFHARWDLALDDEMNPDGTWANTNADGDRNLHPDLHHVLCRIYRPDGSWWDGVSPATGVQSGNGKEFQLGLVDNKTWKIRKPGDGSWTIKVVTADPSGNKSSLWGTAPVDAASRAIPDQPTAIPNANITFVGDGKRVKAKVKFTYSFGNTFVDDDIDKFQVQLFHHKTDPALDDHPDQKVVDIKPSEAGDEQKIVFSGVRTGWKIAVRYRAVDKKGHKSEWSPTSGTRTVGANRRPGKAKTPTTRADEKAIVAKWKAPDRWATDPQTGTPGVEFTTDFKKSDVAYYKAELINNNTLAVVATAEQVLNEQFRFRERDDGQDLVISNKYSVRVTPVGHAAEYDDAASIEGDTISGGDVAPLPIATSDNLVPASSPTPTAFGHIDKIIVQWNNINNADPIVFELHMGTAATFTPSATTLVTEGGAAAKSSEKVAWTVTAQPNGTALGTTTYYFKTRSKDIDGVATSYSAASNGAAATAPLTSVNTGTVASDGGTPNAPTQPQGTSGYKSAVLSWSSNGGTSDPLIYDVYRGGGHIVTIEATHYVDQGLAAGSTYTYSVRARSKLSGNTSGFSGSTSVTASSVPPADIVAGGVSAAWTVSGSISVPNTSGARVQLDGGDLGTGYRLVAYKTDGTRTFSIDDGGNAFFAGALSAATGTFSGDISGASGTFTGNISGAAITGSSLETTNGSPRGVASKVQIASGQITFYANTATATINAGSGVGMSASLWMTTAQFSLSGTFAHSGGNVGFYGVTPTARISMSNLAGTTSTNADLHNKVNNLLDNLRIIGLFS